jgi:hypothetical protein
MAWKTAWRLALLALTVWCAIALIPGCGSSAGSSSDNGNDPDGGGGDDDASVDVFNVPQQQGCNTYPGQSPASLPGAGCCADSPSHCAPTSALPASIDSAFNTCANNGGLCVPDTIIQAGSEYVPTPCHTHVVVFDLDGVCLSKCITLVSGNSQVSLLKQETCGQGELCVPCNDPTTNKPTGACSLTTLVCGGDAGTSGDDGGGVTCPYTGPPIIDPTKFPDCTPACGGAHCVPANIVPAADQAQLAACTSNGQPGFCAPDDFIASDGKSVPKTCTSVAQSEGRCLSTCLPAIAAQADLLPQDVCAAGEKCAPCYDPVAADPSKPTGACSLACDKPAKPPTVITCPYSGPPIIDPSTFPPCSPACAGAHCVPSSLVPASDQSQLATCTVNGGPGFCAPDAITSSGGEGVPASCTSVAGAEGRCMSTCLPAIAAEADVLPQANCKTGEKCAPCYDPVASDPTKPTGACSLACDKPKKPPTVLICPYTGPPVIDPSTFPACQPACAGAHCVPASIIPTADQSQLAKCTVNGAPGFCAPDTITEGGGESVPPTCTSLAGAEGRCMSTCLPEIASEASLLPQDVCPSGTVCAPCYNPASSTPKTPTGACGLACDKPSKPPVVLSCPWTGPPVLNPSNLPQCDNGGCSGAHCLPAAEVPTSVQSQLAPCNGGKGFCAPDNIIQTADNFIPTSCDPFPGSGAPGRCLSSCLPEVAKEAAAGTLQTSSCASNEYCVPCNDPFTGASTGACDLGCDTPPATPFKFPTCCDDGSGTLTGTCVPTVMVPSGERSELNQSGNGNSAGCPNSGANYLCVPDEYLPAPYNSIPLQGCPATIFNYCGVCVSQCIVNSGLSILGPSDCAANHKCVPCTGPIGQSGTPGCSQFCP